MLSLQKFAWRDFIFSRGRDWLGTANYAGQLQLQQRHCESFTAFEMEKNISGMTGPVIGQNNLCAFLGHFGGLIR
jgi:hypothetical protein